MPDIINEYQKWKQQGEDLRIQARASHGDIDFAISSLKQCTFAEDVPARISARP